MKREVMWAGMGLLALAAIEGCSRAEAQSGKNEPPREVQLTIYKEDFALVHEKRPVQLAVGRTHLQLDRVSKTLDPNSVIFDGANVVAQTYDLGVPSGTSLLKRLEGKPVQMLWNSQDGRPGDRIDGVLEASQEGGFVIRSGDKLYVNPNGTIVATGEASLVTMPRLSVDIDGKASSQDLGFAYQTRGMSWSSDYIGRLTPEGDAMELECWATLENHTGIDYPNAKITLVAGSPNRATTTPLLRQRGQGRSYEYEAKDKMEMLGGFEASGFAPQSIGELYAYKVPATASVGQEQMNRVKMLSSTRVPVKKDYSIRLDPLGAYEYGYYNTSPRRQNAQLAISLVNDEQSGLGQPLPSGAVRLYDAGPDGNTAFVGAASIGDTPKNQHVNLTLSKVFDVYSDSRVAKSEKAGKHLVRRTFETVLHNEKKSAVDVRLVQSVYGEWKLVAESDKSKKIDAGTFQRTIQLEPGQEKTVTWTADFKV